MLDKSYIGHVFPAFTAEVERGRLRFFAKAIGESNPIYTDEEAAKAAGYRALPAPPTFTSVLDQESPDFLPGLASLIQFGEKHLPSVNHPGPALHSCR